jgi:hypothetical protein
LASTGPTCFVLMPFLPELNYFFLYVSDHLERRHGIVCRRADQRFSTKPVLEKIVEQIRAADIVIADCTGNNPNVLYELGIAHALGKDVILVTQDSTAAAPSNIRPFEFVKYDLAHHREFLERLDAAVNDLLVARYDRLFEAAGRLFERYRQEANAAAQRVTKEAFTAAVKTAERTEAMPAEDDVPAFAEFVLPAIVRSSDDVEVMTSINSWLVTLR